MVARHRPEFLVMINLSKETHLVSIAEVATRALATVPTAHINVVADGIGCAWVLEALIDINAGGVVVVEHRALLALALEAADGVLTNFHIATR